MMLEALTGLRTKYPGCYVNKALVVIGREEGAYQTLLDRNIQLVSISKKSDFPIPV
jgi:hypothetical protein